MSADAITTVPTPPPPAEPTPTATPAPPPTPTPWSWRLGIAAAILLLGGGAFLLREIITPRGQALAGVFCFFGLVAMFSANLRAVNWRTIAFGVGIQLFLAVMVLRVEAVYNVFHAVGEAVKVFISFSDRGAQFVFGNLADARPPDAGGTWSR